MRFYEYESRRIVERAGIPVTDYGFATTAAEAREAAERIDGPTVIKSQVLTGGRMKAGGVKFADSPEEAEALAAEILELEIGGHMPVGVLVDPKAEIEQEYYAAVLWDGRAKRPMMLFSDMGGIDIEQVAAEHPDHVGRGHLSNLHPVSDFEAKQVVARCGITGPALNRATVVLARLARVQRNYDMTLAEINPLARLADGSFVALDAHMEMEDEAVGRHKRILEEIGADLSEPREMYEPSEFERNVKAIDSADHRGVIQGKDHGFTGNLGLVIGAGGGSLTLTDAVRSQGGKPANYAEIGGNPSVAKSKGLAMEVLKKDGVEKIAVMMSIVSNTRVDIVARGVIKACLELGKDPAETIAIFRIPGAWEEEGYKILDKYGVEYARSHDLDVGCGRHRRGEDPGRRRWRMSILLNENFTFIVQGITGREAVNLTRECLDYGSKIVGGVTPGRKGREVHGVPVFDTVEQVVEHHGSPPDGAVVTVPPAFTKDAVLEAIENGIGLIVVVTERIPGRTSRRWSSSQTSAARGSSAPTASGVIAPGVAKMGGIGGPAKDAKKAYEPGRVGVMSRSGGMTTEISSSLTAAGLGVSTAVSIGGDAIIGSTYAELMPLFEADAQTEAIVIYTEPGGRMEAELVDWRDANESRLPIVAFMAGKFMDDEEMQGMSFGHAGTIVEGKEDSATEKIARLEAAGIPVVERIHEIPDVVKEKIGG